MKVIVVGSGGREHAIAWKLSESSLVEKVVCVPGNGGTAMEKKCVNVNPDNCPYLNGETGIKAAVKIAQKEGCDMAVIGPEDPLAQGYADAFWKEGIKTVGPKMQGAQLEASKDLSKAFMKKYNVACASSETFTNKETAIEVIKHLAVYGQNINISYDRFREEIKKECGEDFLPKRPQKFMGSLASELRACGIRIETKKEKVRGLLYDGTCDTTPKRGFSISSMTDGGLMASAMPN